MSHVDGEHSIDPYIHFTAGMKDFFRVDTVRFINIFGNIQYGLLYAIIFFFVGIIIEALFPPFDPNIGFHQLAVEVVLQCIVVAIAIFYVRKFIEAIPGLLTFFPKVFNLDNLITKGFIPYGIAEFKGEAMMSLILVGTEVNLLKKISRLSILGTKYFLKI